MNEALNKLAKGNTGTLNSKLPNTKRPKNSFRHEPHTKTNPFHTLSNNVGKQNSSIHVIDYICNTAEHLNTVINTEDFSKYTLNMTPKLKINQEQSEEISNFLKNPNLILFKADKNLGWTLILILWFLNEYNRQLTDTSTYKLTNKLEISSFTANSNVILSKLQSKYKSFLQDFQLNKHLNKQSALNVQLHRMNLLSKVHKLDEPASSNNLNEVKGGPIITVHFWTTSNPSILLGHELDSVISKLKDKCSEINVPFPAINSTEELVTKLNAH